MTPAAARRAAIDVTELPTAEGREPGYRGTARRGGELEIRHKWAPGEIVSLVGAGLFWKGIQFASILGGLPALQAIGLVVSVAGAAFFGYCAAARHFNKTVVRATPSGVTVRHAPLPWPGNRSVAAHEIKGLACEAVAPRRPLRPSRTFALTASLHGGRKVRLLSGLPDRDQAVEIAQRLEQHRPERERAVGLEARLEHAVGVEVAQAQRELD
ncbi:MAG TPA: hypothetical protein VFS00_31895, partial [Polyangiaceae bacterium]|nr:hypothetical protein [Polyangiaceae bacterium]